MPTLLALAWLIGQAPAPTPAGAPELPPAAAAQYQEQFLTVEDSIEVTDGQSARTLHFTRGRYREPLTDEQFLSALGRQDEVARRHGRQRLYHGLLAGALASLVVTAVVNVWPDQKSCGQVTDPGFGPCVEAEVDAHRHSGPPVSLLIGAGVGMGLMAGALAVRPLPLDGVEMRRAADQHNQRLRDRLKGVAVSGRF